jgi:hypothetical protein
MIIRTPSPISRSRTRSYSRSRSLPRERERSRTPEVKRRRIFYLFESDFETQHEYEEEYLEEAKPGDLLVFSGNNQENTWKKICRIENGIKKWKILPNNNAFGKKRKSTRKRRRPTKRRRHIKRRTMTTVNRGEKKSKKRKVRRGQFKKLRKKFTKKKIYLKGGGLRERREAALSNLLTLTDVGRNEDGQLETEETKKLLKLDTDWKDSELENFLERTKRIEDTDEVNQFNSFLKELDHYGAENINRVWISEPVKEFILNPDKLTENKFDELIAILNKNKWKLVERRNR